MCGVRTYTLQYFRAIFDRKALRKQGSWTETLILLGFSSRCCNHLRMTQEKFNSLLIKTVTPEVIQIDTLQEHDKAGQKN